MELEDLTEERRIFSMMSIAPYRSVLYREFTLDNTHIDEIRNVLENRIEDIILSRDLKIKLSLQMESILLNWQGAMPEDTQASIKLYRIFNRYYIRVTTKGAEHNPLLDTTPYGVPKEYTKLLSNVESDWDIKPVFSYSQDENIIMVKLPQKQLSSMENTVVAVVLAVATYGLLSFLPEGDAMAIADNYIDPITDLIIGVITMLAMVMIFTSITKVIASIGDRNTFTRYGKTTILKIQADNFIATFVGLIGTVAFFGVLKPDSSLDSSIVLQVFNIMVGIIPTNVVNPFFKGDGLQILFMGTCLGLFLLSFKSETQTVIKFIEELDFIMQGLLTAACKKIHYLVYFSVVDLLVSGIADKIGVIGHVLIAQVVFSYGLLAVNLIFVSVSCGISILSMLKGLSHVFLVGASSGAAITMLAPLKDAFSRNFKVKKQVMDFVIPVELIMSKPDMALNIIIWAALTLTMYDIQITVPQMLIAGFMTALLASAIPPVPGGLFVVQGIIYQGLGIPVEAMAIAIATDPIFRIVRTGLRGVLFGSNILYLNHKLESSN